MLLEMTRVKELSEAVVEQAKNTPFFCFLMTFASEPRHFFRHCQLRVGRGSRALPLRLCAEQQFYLQEKVSIFSLP